MKFKKVYLAVILLCFTFCTQQKGSFNAQGLPAKFEKKENRGKVEYKAINEASGLAVSRSNPNFIWTHNDSGDQARVFLMKNDGTHLGVFKLKDAKNRDWEDICIGAGPEKNKNYIYVGEIGDNRAKYGEYKIYRFEEPNLNNLTYPIQQEITDYTTISYKYPDGKRDAETLMLDPLTKDLYIVSKREHNVGIYRLAYPYKENNINTLEKVGTLPYTWINAGDISSDGKEILIKNYTNIYYWKRDKNQTIAEALKKRAKSVPYSIEQQGEAVAWEVDGSGYFTLSEKKIKDVTLNFYRRKIKKNGKN